MTILVIDKDPAIIRYIESMLTSKQYRPLLAGSDKEALDLLDYEDIDLVLMDFSLRDRKCAALCRKVREHPRGRHIPLLAATSRHPSSQARARELGAADTVIKPVKQKTLLQKIQALLKG